MKFLVIETSCEKSFVLLSCKGVVTQVALPPRGQRDHLLLGIDQLLTSASLKLNDLDFIGVGNGPGSFTGTRIGVLTAKTLCFAKNLPLISFCSLLAYTPPTSKPFQLIVDAKSHGFYIYDGTTTSLESTLPETQALFSLHPDRIPKPTTQATFNLPFLIKHLERSFAKGETISHSSLEVTYLHSP